MPLTSLLGIRKVVLAINKMDLVNYAQSNFDKIVSDFKALNDSLGFTEITSIPISALLGDNIISRSHHMPWYKGLALLGYLEAVNINNDSPGPLRFPIQYVLRTNKDFRGYAGRMAGGGVRSGQK